MTLPATLSVNAWTGNGAPATSPLAPGALGWALGAQGAAPLKLLAPEAEADPRDWRDPRVGWGLVLPDTDALDDAAKARGEDAPEPLRDAARGPARLARAALRRRPAAALHPPAPPLRAPRRAGHRAQRRRARDRRRARSPATC